MPHLVSPIRESGLARPLRLAVLGMIPGNGHPYSWSAILNGYDPSAMAACPYPVIREYLGRRRDALDGLEGAAVTHLWTDDPAEAANVARFAKIPHVVDQPERVIGEVDAVLIATDDGDDHVRRVRPFVEAGLPVFVDKPLATNADDLRTFLKWHRDGARILSSSGMRYAPELRELDDFEWEWITAMTCNTWKRYGIHVLEPVDRLIGPGWVSVRSFAAAANQFVHLTHESGRVATLAVLPEAKAAFGTFHAGGRAGTRSFQCIDTYSAFRSQLLSFTEFANTGRTEHSFDQTVELMVILLAATESLRQGGEEISILDFRQSLEL